MSNNEIDNKVVDQTVVTEEGKPQENSLVSVAGFDLTQTSVHVLIYGLLSLFTPVAAFISYFFGIKLWKKGIKDSFVFSGLIISTFSLFVYLVGFVAIMSFGGKVVHSMMEPPTPSRAVYNGIADDTPIPSSHIKDNDKSTPTQTHPTSTLPSLDMTKPSDYYGDSSSSQKNAASDSNFASVNTSVFNSSQPNPGIDYSMTKNVRGINSDYVQFLESVPAVGRTPEVKQLVNSIASRRHVSDLEVENVLFSYMQTNNERYKSFYEGLKKCDISSYAVNGEHAVLSSSDCKFNDIDVSRRVIYGLDSFVKVVSNVPDQSFSITRGGQFGIIYDPKDSSKIIAVAKPVYDGPTLKEIAIFGDIEKISLNT